MKIPWRKIHRWLGLFIGLQVVAWMISGLYFAWIPIEHIRGEHLTVESTGFSAGEVQDISAPSGVHQLLEDVPGAESVESIMLRNLRGQLVWHVGIKTDDQLERRLLPVATGSVMPKMTTEEAANWATAALIEPREVQSVELVTEHIQGSEYRGRSLPIYRITFEDDQDLRLYLDAWTGEIVARRTGQWRLFDLLWSLHIMDYGDRDDFNHPVLIFFAAAALVLSVGGYVLWWISSVFVRNRRRAALKSG